MRSVFKILSLNVCGLKHLPKRRCIAKVLRKEKVKLVCLQDTHLNKAESKYLDHVFSGRITHAPSSGQSSGVMLGIA